MLRVPLCQNLFLHSSFTGVSLDLFYPTFSIRSCIPVGVRGPGAQQGNNLWEGWIYALTERVYGRCMTRNKQCN